MRILLVANYVLDDQANMSRYTDMLQRHMRARGHIVEVIRPKPLFGRLAPGEWFRKWLGYADKFVLFPIKLGSVAQGFDLVHICDHNNAMYLAYAGGIPASITCHEVVDIAAAEGRIAGKRVPTRYRARQMQILHHLQGAKNVVCLSWNTWRELASTHGNESQRGVVIPNAVEVDASSIREDGVLAVRRKFGLKDSDRYLLYAGEERWFRNRLGALRIFRLVRERVGNELKFVVAGARLSREMRQFVAANLPPDSVVEIARPAQEELWSLYAGATALLFPSLYEGFGWPIAEAQSCGCPVITSQRAPMTEVAGPAAIYINPSDETGAADVIAARLNDIPELRAAGLENAKRFQPETVFASYEGFFQGVLRTRRRTDVVIAPNEAEGGAE
jgi:glycosyltransferase involved in cell wall biosynthesis